MWAGYTQNSPPARKLAPMNLTPEMIAAAAEIARQGEIAGEIVKRAVAAARGNGYTVAVWLEDGSVSCRKDGVRLSVTPADVFGDHVAAEMEAAFASGLLRGFRFS